MFKRGKKTVKVVIHNYLGNTFTLKIGRNILDKKLCLLFQIHLFYTALLILMQISMMPITATAIIRQ
ncbi:hypothetical protein SAMN04488514_105175 [Kriegella aquimaris]|uniref:Uncharacterized protein n=1 Tax=Kriegella aquimaris TaxID=192904 RepID=A0A1G9QRQ7_9FLAO|nr:hypothetical protein SAMN04488514_105175 [Kriegella aquimaris]